MSLEGGLFSSVLFLNYPIGEDRQTCMRPCSGAAEEEEEAAWLIPGEVNSRRSKGRTKSAVTEYLPLHIPILFLNLNL